MWEKRKMDKCGMKKIREYSQLQGKPFHKVEGKYFTNKGRKRVKVGQNEGIN